ncbi:hypothetical protein CHCC14821_1101 [Bacillus paralicheniformis]|nr:hypothetical protein CHCC14821_1101 [Bacillus paralicheniformis]TWM66020.1 hypothetical protein CHCC14814_2770 [Bacillus paralicheniformis]
MIHTGISRDSEMSYRTISIYKKNPSTSKKLGALFVFL